jgi:hypothetical protein
VQAIFAEEKCADGQIRQTCLFRPDLRAGARSVQALEALASELLANGHVRLVLKDDGTCEGTIAERAAVQVYFDPTEQRQGINGELRLERADEPDWHRWMWLDEIARVEHFDYTLGSEN